MTSAGKEREKAKQLRPRQTVAAVASVAAAAAAAASDATNAICRARFSSARFTCRTDFQRSAALFGARRQKDRKRELSPISATGGNRPIWRQVELMRSRCQECARTRGVHHYTACPHAHSFACTCYVCYA